MASEAEDSRAPIWYLVLTGLVAFGVLFGVWIALVGSAGRQDDVAALVAAAVGAGVGWSINVRGRAVPQLRWRDVTDLARLGPQVVTQTVRVFAATWRRARGEGPPSGYRTIQTDATGGGWAASRRSSMLTFILSFAPETVLVDLDEETGEATVHDFVARR